ncbi:hypothetical protein [Sphingomonas sp. SUN039]|uniref:hypothetical protein n=1 Tax=Sphingomonas sp. SUN039 TaxID=2937787 RepID=UPI0021646526|nr:hypothetical protein [Sphingomonas sp. SUN039]UVO53817.1 hypothetical protein M0209_06660 [Sphingomonas sp. SUN039]
MALLAIPVGMIVAGLAWLLQRDIPTVVRSATSMGFGLLLPAIFAVAFALDARTEHRSDEVWEILALYGCVALASCLGAVALTSALSALRSR